MKLPDGWAYSRAVIIFEDHAAVLEDGFKSQVQQTNLVIVVASGTLREVELNPEPIQPFCVMPLADSS
jgi:hypothetical protein